MVVKSKKPETVVTTMRLPEDVIDMADQRARELDVSRTKVVIGLVREHCRPRRQKKSPPSSSPDIFD